MLRKYFWPSIYSYFLSQYLYIMFLSIFSFFWRHIIGMIFRYFINIRIINIRQFRSDYCIKHFWLLQNTTPVWQQAIMLKLQSINYVRKFEKIMIIIFTVRIRHSIFLHSRITDKFHIARRTYNTGVFMRDSFIGSQSPPLCYCYYVLKKTPYCPQKLICDNYTKFFIY